MRRFDYSFLRNGLLPAKMINLTSSIASLKTMAGVRKNEYAQIFTELEAVAKVQSVKSSNAIECPDFLHYCCYIKMDMMPVNMFLLKSRLITINPYIMMH